MDDQQLAEFDGSAEVAFGFSAGDYIELLETDIPTSGSGSAKGIIINNTYRYTLPTAGANTLGGVKTTSTVSSTAGLIACPIISGVPYYQNTTYTLSGLGGIGTVSASGTAPLQLSASKKGTTVTINGSVSTAGTDLGVVKTTSTVSDVSTYTACPIVDGVIYYKDTNTTYSSLKNPNSLTVKGNGTQSFTYDGSSAKTLNIKAGPNVSVSSDTSGNITISSSYKNTTYSVFGAASASAAGSNGLVPAPAAGNQAKFLRGDGTWATPTNTKNSAGAEDTSSKIFLVGTTSQATGTSYSHDTVYVGTDGCLYSNSTKVSVEGHTHSYVPTSRTVNGKALSANITLSASDVSAAPASHTHTWSQISDRASCTISTSGTITGSKVYGAVWNDYAEYRATKDEIQAGRVVTENGDDTLSLATERLMPGANIVSDTFGFAIGETENSKTPLAISGRVLAYPYEDRNSYKPGDPVCSGPNGTVSKMTREEVMMYPDRILGTVSAIPEYETWGTGNVVVNGRIWIKV